MDITNQSTAGFELSGSKSWIAMQFSFFTGQVSSEIHFKPLVLNIYFKDRVVFLLIYNALFEVVSINLLNILKITLNIEHSYSLTNLFVIMSCRFMTLLLVNIKLPNNPWNINFTVFFLFVFF